MVLPARAAEPEPLDITTINLREYTLGDILGLVGERVITYNECTEILEEQLSERHPHSRSALSVAYKHFRESCKDELGCFDAPKYCRELCELERTLK